jgi:hypothetical protein
MDENDSVIQIIYPRINNPKIGTYTFFSSKTNIKGAKRFAVFVDIDGLSPLYIEPVDSDKLNHLYDPENIEASTAITYMNGSQQIWCIKSPYYFSEINEVFIEISHDEKTEDIIGEPAEEPTEEPAEEPTEEPTEESAEEPTEESAEESAEEPTDKSAEESADKSAEEHSDKSAEEPADKSAEEPSDKSSEEPTDKSAKDKKKLPTKD